MEEIRFHGRGGQGAVVASEILASALFKEGKHVQAFPAFGVERRGAPVTAFLRVDERPIRRRCGIEEPNGVVILDSTLISVVEVTAGLTPKGWILVNVGRDPQRLTSFTDQGWTLFTVDASAIATKLGLGSRTSPIVNTAILGALASATGLVGLDSVVQAVGEEAPVNPEGNMEAARQAYRSVRMSGADLTVELSRGGAR